MLTLKVIVFNRRAAPFFVSLGGHASRFRPRAGSNGNTADPRVRARSLLSFIGVRVMLSQERAVMGEPSVDRPYTDCPLSSQLLGSATRSFSGALSGLMCCEIRELEVEENKIKEASHPVKRGPERFRESISAAQRLSTSSPGLRRSDTKSPRRMYRRAAAIRSQATAPPL